MYTSQWTATCTVIFINPTEFGIRLSRQSMDLVMGMMNSFFLPLEFFGISLRTCKVLYVKL
jgi:hypothetical protein